MSEPLESTLPEGWKRYRSLEDEMRPLVLRGRGALVVELYATPKMMLRGPSAPLSVIRWALAYADHLEGREPGAPMAGVTLEQARAMASQMPARSVAAVLLSMRDLRGNDG